MLREDLLGDEVSVVTCEMQVSSRVRLLAKPTTALVGTRRKNDDVVGADGTWIGTIPEK